MSEPTLFRLRIREGERRRSVWCRVRFDRDTGLSERAYPEGHVVLRRLQRSHAGRILELVPADEAQGGLPVVLLQSGGTPPAEASPPPRPAGPPECDDSGEDTTTFPCQEEPRESPVPPKPTPASKSYFQGHKPKRGGK